MDVKIEADDDEDPVLATAFNARRFLHALFDFMQVTSIQVDGGSDLHAP